jgi:hypothetical protein
MPQIPIIVPLIVVGLVVGSIVKSKSPRISKRKLASASLVAGLLNSIHAYLLYSLAPAQTATRVTGAPTTASLAPTSEGAFVAASFLAAFLIVLLVLGIALAYVRIRRGEELEEVPEQASEEEPTLTPS